jgi:hypothetical protein
MQLTQYSCNAEMVGYCGEITFNAVYARAQNLNPTPSVSCGLITSFCPEAVPILSRSKASLTASKPPGNTSKLFGLMDCRNSIRQLRKHIPLEVNSLPHPPTIVQQ